MLKFKYKIIGGERNGKLQWFNSMGTKWGKSSHQIIRRMDIEKSLTESAEGASSDSKNIEKELGNW